MSVPAKRVRLPLPVGYTRCRGIDCDQKADCSRHATIWHDRFDGTTRIKNRVCSPDAVDAFLPLFDPEPVI